MKTLYIECNMGAAGDMLTAALLELLPSNEQEEILSILNDMGLANVCVKATKAVSCGITGTHVQVLINGTEEGEHEYHHEHEHHHGHHHEHEHTEGHHHSSLKDIEHIVYGHLAVSDKVKADILKVYEIIAEAESKVHGRKVDEIHFHEVGNLDAIADITAVCLIIDRLRPDKIIVSPIHVGSGEVKCAHGILPVPAPATALILKGVPIYSKDIKGELCTPTGAALLTFFADEFGDMPIMKVEQIGYGMGSKEFSHANCVRAMLGQTDGDENEVYELILNVDDMTGEEIGFAMETLLDAGALEVFTTPVGMKKSRPGVMLTTICNANDKDNIVNMLFKHTTTIGIRENRLKRYTLNRRIAEDDISDHKVKNKISEGYGVTRHKYEYEDLVKVVKDTDGSLVDINRNRE